MLNKDVYADADKDEATDHFGGTAEQRAEEASDQDPSSCHNQCREPDRSSGVQDVYIEEGQADTDGHGVEAGRYCGDDEKAEGVTSGALWNSRVPLHTLRSEERRVGKECVRTCRSRGSPCN